MNISTEEKQAKYELENKQTIEKFGREKCLKAYETSSKHIPLKPGQKYNSWQEQVADELNVSEDEAMSLWSAGNSIIQDKDAESDEEIIKKFGKDKCMEIYEDISSLSISGSEWMKSLSKKYSIDEMDVVAILLAGSRLSMKESAPNIAETMRQYHNNKHKLHSCPKKECNGKLHVGISQSEEFNGLYICDECTSTFRKK